MKFNTNQRGRDNSEEVYQIYNQDPNHEDSNDKQDNFEQNAKAEEDSYYKMPQRYDEQDPRREKLFRNRKIEEKLLAYKNDEDLENLKQLKMK